MPYRIDQIDSTYPVAGVDNESQGFRDNFSAIKDSLSQAQQDIVGLQSTRVDRTDEETNFNNNTIKNINLGNVSYDSFLLTGLTNNNVEGQPVDYSNGSYQSLSISSGTTEINPQLLSFENWPELGRYAVIRVQVNSQTGPEQFFKFVYPPAVSFFYDSSWPRVDDEIQTVLSITGTNKTKVFEFWTVNSGQNIFARYLGEFEQVLS